MSAPSPRPSSASSQPKPHKLKRQHSVSNFHENAIVTDITIPWLYESHSVYLLFMVLGVIFYIAFYYETGDEFLNLTHGLWLCAFLFLAIGCLVFPAGPYIRPHPIIWRLLFGVNVLYGFGLLLLLCQTPMGARKGLRFLDSSLGQPLQERNYAVDCSLSYRNVMGTMDVFVPAHLLGWAAKAVLIRDRTLVWFFSALWELIEMATCFFIPNFAECWWDSIFLDFLICNGIGIEFGLYVSKKIFATTKTLDVPQKRNKWLSMYEIPTIRGKFKRFVLQFTPFKLDPMHWETTKNIKRFFFVHLLIICLCLVDLNGFLLKLFLWIPSNHQLFIGRELLFAITGIVTTHQGYLYVCHEKCKNLGSISWLTLVLLTLELGICYKCRPVPFPETPTTNQICYAIAAVLYLVFCFVVLRQFPRQKQPKRFQFKHLQNTTNKSDSNNNHKLKHKKKHG